MGHYCNMEIDICIDFDGTIVDHRFPDIGPEVPYAFEVMKWLQSLGFVNLILYTMRSTHMYNGSDYLTEAVEFCKKRGINFAGINENPTQDWTISRKVYGKFYIDNSAVGCPLINVHNFHRQCVDWVEVKKILTEKFQLAGFI